MNHCIKTGADVWDSAMGCAIHCDAYFVPVHPYGDVGVYIFRYIQPFTFPSKEQKWKDLRSGCHFVLLNEEVYQQSQCLDIGDNTLCAPSLLVKVRMDLTTGELLK
jgi:hypothetical protein